MREGEVDGVDYHFITEGDFDMILYNGDFCEVGKYNGWNYGTLKCGCTDDKVAVLTPHGLRQMKKLDDLNIVSFYINVPRRDRLIKILQRGDSIDESCRRSASDVGQYDGIEDEVDFVIHNEGYQKTPKEIANEIIEAMKMVRS
jgi:guanylate kinase